MDSVASALFTSWDRQTAILSALAGRIDEGVRHAKASPDGWAIDEHLCHIHECRYGWLSKVSPPHSETFGEVYKQQGESWVPIGDLDEIRRQLGLSGQAVRDAVEQALQEGKTQVGPYSHPVFFLQHMLWHEGYHFSLIVLALRNAGAEPPEEWEEANVWGVWRS